MAKKARRSGKTLRKTSPPPTKRPSKAAIYRALLRDVAGRIRHAQTRAMLAVNAELVRLYWEIGRLVDQRQQQEGWGSAVIPRLARDLCNELPAVKGFSERNISRMIAFYRAWPDPVAILPQPAAELTPPPFLPQAAAKLPSRRKSEETNFDAPPVESLLWSIPWFHHVVLMQKVKDPTARVWYMRKTVAEGWSRNLLTMAIDRRAHERQGRAITNFDRLLPAPQSDLAQQSLKDPYIFDFLTLEAPFHERELETELVRQVEKFLLELGQGFAFVGRQYPLRVGEEDYHLDLLFYHLVLRAYVVIDLKTGQFKPEFAGKMNFYCNVVNDQLRHPTDGLTIGLILCQTKDEVLAEYSLAGIDRPIGVSSYELTRALPKSLRSVLPTVEEIEAELSPSEANEAGSKPRAALNPTRTKKA